jgi:hypothetical protein
VKSFNYVFLFDVYLLKKWTEIDYSHDILDQSIKGRLYVYFRHITKTCLYVVAVDIKIDFNTILKVIWKANIVEFLD